MSFSNINPDTASNGLGSQSVYSKENTPMNTQTSVRTEMNSLQELTPGKVFAGEIVSVGKERVTLKLDSGQLIQALSNQDVQLTEGQLLAFMVKSNTGKQLAIKPMFDVTLQSPSVLKALENAGIPVSAKSADLINTLMQEQMPIDRETVTKFLRQMNLNPQEQIKLLVDLQKMGETVNSEAIEKFKEYQNHEYPLQADAKELSANIVETISGMAENDLQGVGYFLEVTDIFLPKQKESALEATLQTPETAQKFSEDISGSSGERVTEQTFSMEQLENLSSIQREDWNAVSNLEERFQGQNVQTEAVLEGLKVLNQQATSLLEELKGAMEAQTLQPKQNDVIARLYAAFASYERSENAIQQARDAVALKQDVLQPNKSMQDSTLEFSNETLQGILDEPQRNALAQKIYKITGDIRQYFQVRTGDMKPEEVVKLLREQIPEEEVLSTIRQENGILDSQSVPQELFKGEGTTPQNQTKGALLFTPNQLRDLVLSGESGKAEQVAESLKQMPESPEQVAVNREQTGKSPEQATVSEKQTGESLNQTVKNPEQENTKTEFQQQIVQKQLEKLPKVKELFQSSEFKTVLKAAIENQMLLKPEELTKETVKEYYEKMQQQLHRLSELAGQTQSQDSPVPKSVNTMQQNVEYINQLNQLYSYVQLPLKLANQNTNSELYVLTNKRRMRQEGDAFTALLHLDMERLGGMDVYITMKAKKVAARFYLEHQGIAMFLKEHSEPLSEILKEKGFDFTAEFVKKPENTNLVEEFTSQNVENPLESKYSFDIRM